LTLRRSNSGLSLATAPSSVVHTGVKSFGCENSTPQDEPSQSSQAPARDASVVRQLEDDDGHLAVGALDAESGAAQDHLHLGRGVEGVQTARPIRNHRFSSVGTRTHNTAGRPPLAPVRLFESSANNQYLHSSGKLFSMARGVLSYSPASTE